MSVVASTPNLSLAIPLISCIPFFLRNGSLRHHRPKGLLHIAMKKRLYHHPCGVPGASDRLALLPSRG